MTATRFRALDGLRLVGALAVLTTHVGFDSGTALHGWMAGVLSRLDVGVALFFVISGFLLFRPHAMAHLEGRQHPATGAYLVRRAVRILPVLWVAVAAAWLLLGGGSSADYLAHAVLVQIYVGTPLTPGLTQLWSLATEVAFYLVLPLLARCVCRGPRDARWVRRLAVGAVGLVATGAAWMAGATAVGLDAARLWLPGFAGWFALGMAVAAWHAGRSVGVVPAGRLDVVGAYPGTVWALGAGLLVVASTPVAGPLDLTEPTALQAATKSILYALIGALAVVPTVATVHPATEPAAVRALSGRAGVALGAVSYGVFAYHVIVLALVERWLGLTTFDGVFWWRWLPTTLLALGLAALSYRLMERPLMRYARPNRRGPGSPHTEAATASHTAA